MIERGNGCATKRLAALCFLLLHLLLSHFAVAQVQIEPAASQSAETAALIQQVKNALAQAPAHVRSINVRVTIGRTAFEAALDASDARPIVAAYLSSTEFDAALKGREHPATTAVLSNPDPRDQAALARALLGPSTVAVFDTAAVHGLVQLLGESVHAIPASGQQKIDSLLRAVDPFDAVIALPDPTVLNRSNIGHVVRTLYERRKVLIGYSVTLSRVGALASIYVRPEAVARDVIDVLSEYTASGTLPPPAFVSDVDVEVNHRLARSLNIAVPDHAELLNAVRSWRSEGAP